MNAGSSIQMIDLEDYKEVNLHTYQQLIGKLIYLAYGTRPDIIFAVRQLSKHNADPRKRHLQVAKRVVRYLKRTVDMGLVFGQKTANCLLREPSPYGLIGYADSNFAKNPKD